jgi:lipase chaperone LimK
MMKHRPRRSSARR